MIVISRCNNDTDARGGIQILHNIRAQIAGFVLKWGAEPPSVQYPCASFEAYTLEYTPWIKDDGVFLNSGSSNFLHQFL